MSGADRRTATSAPRETGPVAPIRAALACRGGSASIEFGFAVMIFLAFVFGTIELSRAMWTEHALHYAAEQATRYVIGNPTASTSEIQTYAESQITSMDPSEVTVTVVNEALDGINYVTVRLVYPFRAVLAFVPVGPINLTGVSRVPLSS